MRLLLPKYYLQSFLFICFFISPKLLSGQYSVEKKIMYDEKKGTKAIIPPIESFHAKGDKLYFVANNSITITDNNGLLVEKIPTVVIPLTNDSIGNIPVDSDNNFYVFEESKYIRKYSPDRVLLNTIDISEYYHFITNAEIAIDSENNIYFGNLNYITVFNKDGIWQKKIGKQGYGEGEFIGSISKIVISNSGTIYVKSGFGYADENDKIQMFNKEGVFLRKIVLNQLIKDFCIDNEDNIYILSHIDNKVYLYDKTGKALPTITVSDNKNIASLALAKKSDNKLIAYCYNHEDKEYFYYDVDTKAKSDIFTTVYDTDYPIGILDTQINPITNNIIFLDKYKVITYDKDFNVVKSAKRFDNGIVANSHPESFSIDSNGKSCFWKKVWEGFYYYMVISENNKNTCIIIADTVVNKILIEKDSINNPIIVVATSKSISSYSLTGDFIKKIITPEKGFISIFNKNPDGIYYLLNSSIKVLERYDANFKLISSQYYEGGGDDFTVTTDGYSHALRRWDWMENHFVSLGAYNSKGQNICETNFDFNYPSRSLIKTFNNQLIIAGLGTDYFSVVNFNYDDKLKPNFIKIPNKIILTTLDKGLDLSTQFSSYAQNLSYKLLNGECIKVSSAGILEVIKAGTAIIELTSPATSIYNSSSSKVEVVITKVNLEVTGIGNIEKKLGDSDFLLDIKSNSPVQPTTLIVSGKSVSLDSQTKKIKIIKEGLSKIKVFYPETDIYNGYFTTISVAVVGSSGTIVKLSPELTAADITKKIDSGDFNLIVNTKSDELLQFSVVEGDAIEVSMLGEVKILKAGITKVKISQIETDKYQSAEIFVTITVEKLDQTIEVGNIPTSILQYSVGFDIKPISSSGLKVSTRVLSGPAKVEGQQVVLLGSAGAIELEFSQEGDVKYKPAPNVNKSVEVTMVLSNLEVPSDMSVKVFPNPITSILQIRSDGKPFGLQIVSMLGKVFFEKEITKEETEIDLSGIKPGNYVLIIQKNNLVQYVKVQKL